MSFSVGDVVADVSNRQIVGTVWSFQPGNIVEVRLGDRAEFYYSYRLEKVAESTNTDQFATGAVRDTQEGKPRPDFLDPNMILRVGSFLEKNAREKYSDFNFDKGIPSQRYMAGLLRHVMKYYAGWRDEDHLSAIIFNAMGLMSNEGTDLDDLHEWRNNYYGKNDD